MPNEVLISTQGEILLTLIRSLRPSFRFLSNETVL